MDNNYYSIRGALFGCSRKSIKNAIRIRHAAIIDHQLGTSCNPNGTSTSCSLAAINVLHQQLYHKDTQKHISPIGCSCNMTEKRHKWSYARGKGLVQTIFRILREMGVQKLYVLKVVGGEEEWYENMRDEAAALPYYSDHQAEMKSNSMMDKVVFARESNQPLNEQPGHAILQLKERGCYECGKMRLILVAAMCIEVEVRR